MKRPPILLLICCTLFFFLSLPAPLLSDEQPALNEADMEEEVPSSTLNTIPTYEPKKLSKKIWKQKKVDFQIFSACVGDVDNDGLNELISTDGQNLRIDQWKYGHFRPLQSSSPNNNGQSFLFWPWTKEVHQTPLDDVNKSNQGMEYIRLSAEDLDDDGQDEVLFTAIKDQKFISGILKYEQGGFSQTIGEPGLYLKITRGKEEQPILLGQRFQSKVNLFHHYSWDGAALRQETPLTPPDDLNLFSVSDYHAPGTLNPAYVTYDTPQKLRFLNSGFSEAATFDSKKYLIHRKVQHRIINEKEKAGKKRFRIPKRMLTGDFNSDGRDDLLMIQNRPLMNMWGFRSIWMRHLVANLVLVNDNLIEFWETKPYRGDILDQAIGDIDNNGTDDLVLFAINGMIPLFKGTEILIYELR